MEEKKVRLSSGLIEFGAAANITTNLWLTSARKKAVIKKIYWHNRTGGNGMLRIGYLTLGAVFTQVLPDILMLNGFDDVLEEGELPICGNDRDGFVADTTAVTGTLGYIVAQATVAGAAGVNVHVALEVEEA